jgi:hypothetical protein
MIEIEIYAPGLRREDSLLHFRSQMDLLPHVRYKVDTHHDVVYYEIDDPTTVTPEALMEPFTVANLQPRLIGQLPEAWYRHAE